MILLSHIAARSLLYQKRRYVSLFLMCLLGMSVTFLCIGLMNGMLSALRHKARIYYGGDLQLIGGMNDLAFDSADPYMETLKSLIPDSVITERITYAAGDTALYFEGNGVRQRAINGVHFDTERHLFSQMNFSEGSIPENAEGSEIILLSKPIADMLECRAGDYITLLAKTIQGYTNTVQLRVAGIFLDSSLFGMYTTYMDISVLRSLIGKPAGWVNRICVYSDKGIKNADIGRIQSALEKSYNMFPLVDNKDRFYDVLYSDKQTEPLYALIKLDANLREIQLLIQAVTVIVVIIFCMLLSIIAVGIGSTYRIIVTKRTNEIGTYMSLGMRKSSIYMVFLIEVFFLLLFSFAAGGILTAVITQILRFFNFSFIPAFDLFLDNGRLVPLYSAVQLAGIMAIVAAATLSTVLYSIHRSINISPVQALRTIN